MHTDIQNSSKTILHLYIYLFSDKSSEVRKDDYNPSEQDILRCRVLTSGQHPKQKIA